jgi:hypothetical protein
MMSYSLEWDSDGLAELADIWMRATDRQAVTDAEHRIERLLAADPLGNGKLLSEGLRYIDVRPLVAYYTVDAARRHVRVEWFRYAP